MNAREFTSIAEERGLVLPLGAWAMRRACANAQGWKDTRLSINIAPVQFNHRDFAGQVLKILHDAGFEPTRLDLCIGEECILAPKADAIAGMALLRQEGVRLTLAGYGAGIASMSHVHRFPFSRLKLDRTCAELSPGMTSAAAVLHSVIHLGRTLGLIVTADGVDTEEQARTLTALGCHELQGQRISRFVSASEFEKFAVNGMASASNSA
jgi:EAL domain-containing protein (putative c-di-GMP-specific phosphodiesterase class I)